MARSLPRLKLPTKPARVVPFAASVAAAKTESPRVPSPSPTLATFEADLTPLNRAETAVPSRAEEAAGARNATLAVVHAEIESLRAYVPSVASEARSSDADATLENGGTTCLSRRVHSASRQPPAAEGGLSGGLFEPPGEWRFLPRKRREHPSEGRGALAEKRERRVERRARREDRVGPPSVQRRRLLEGRGRSRALRGRLSPCRERTRARTTAALAVARAAAVATRGARVESRAAIPRYGAAVGTTRASAGATKGAVGTTRGA